MSLIDLKSKLKYKYKRPENIIEQFIIPCLNEAVAYDRAVGYFGSEPLEQALRGLITFLKKSGSKIRLITCPRLKEEDIDEIKKGLKEQSEVLESEILKEIERIENSENKEVLATLSWLISRKKLEIKIGDINLSRHALFHDKLGIFLDEKGNQVVFYGSLNETYSAYFENYDAIRVLTSWGDDLNKIKTEVQDFNLLWEDLDPLVRTYDISDALKKRILEKYSRLTDEEFFKLYENSEKLAYKEELLMKKFNPECIKPWRFQEKAIEAVKKNNYKGILRMATGTGKTHTTCFCLEQYFKDIKKDNNRILILVPSINLAEQWKDFLKDKIAGNDLLYVYNSDMKKEERNNLNFIWDRQGHNIFLIMTIQILGRFSQLKNRLDFLIADEVHSYGTVNYNNKLGKIIKPNFRLGLSATPTRYYDPEGTKRIFDYFGDIIYQFDIEAAQNEKQENGLTVLCNYIYDVSFVNLTELEQEKVDIINKKIGIQYSIEKELKEPDESSASKNLLTKRALIFKMAKKKIDALRNILIHERENLRQCIIYCEQESQLNDVKELFKELKIRSFAEYDSKTYNREESLYLFKGKNVNFIISMHCLDQGVDIPDCSALILLSSSSNPREYIQRRGRVLRNKPGKNLVKVYEIVALPHTYDPRYKGSVLSQFLRIWEFIKRSISPETALKIKSYLKSFDISEAELENEISKW